MLIDLECMFCSNLMLLPLFYGLSVALLTPSYFAIPLLYLLLHGIGFLVMPIANQLELAYFISLGIAMGAICRLIIQPVSLFPHNPLDESRRSILYGLWFVAFAPTFVGIDTRLPSGFPVGLVLSFSLYCVVFIVARNASYRQAKMQKRNDKDEFYYNLTWWSWQSLMFPMFAAGSIADNTLASSALGGAFTLATALAWQALYPKPTSI